MSERVKDIIEALLGTVLITTMVTAIGAGLIVLGSWLGAAAIAGLVFAFMMSVVLFSSLYELVKKHGRRWIR